jgi:hypothetical protein
LPDGVPGLIGFFDIDFETTAAQLLPRQIAGCGTKISPQQRTVRIEEMQPLQ